MKTLCITGAQATPLVELSRIFNDAGMHQPQPISRGTAIDMDVWNKRVRQALRQGKPIGRLWEQVASDLLLANLESECWGWSSPESVWALDFWAELEPEIRFVLVCISPEALLAECLVSDQGQHSEQECLQRWYDYHRAMLAFYLKHPERCLVVDGQQAQANPQALIERASERWELPLMADRASAVEPSPTEPDRLARYLARQVIESYQSVGDIGQSLEALYAELLTAQQPLAPQQQSYTAYEIYAEASAAELEAESSAQLKQVIREYQQLYAATRDTQWQEAQARTLAQLEGAEQENERLQLQLEQLQEKLESAQQQHNEETRRELEDSQQENGLLLLQLHQVQEELESTFLAKQQLESQSQQQSLDYQAQQALQERLEAAEQQRSDYQHHLEAKQKEITALQQQLKQATDQQQALQTQQADLQRQLGKREADLQQQLQQTSQQNEQARQELEDSQQENELLLLQLHQVQEELEHYFLAHQKLQQQSEEAEARWQRMLQRTPDYSDYQSVQIQAGATGNEALRWRFEQLDLAGRELAQLNLNTRIERDMAVIELTRDGENDAPLLAWPAMYADQRTLTLCAPGDSNTIEPDLQLLQSLTQSDWQLVQRLPRLLEQALGESDLSTEQQQRYRNALHTLQEALNDLPPTLRFDQVTLRNAQINPDYEHLWLDLEHAGWGDERRENWSLRLSCANVGPDQFGTHPKLEIPEQNGQWLESWFAESRDDYGPKWELRFAMPDAMDIGVWNKLSEHDQALMVSILRQLPTMLEHLQAQSVVLARDWQDWHQLIEDIQRTHRKLTHTSRSARANSAPL